MNEGEAFFDTNVLVYLISGEASKAARSEEILSFGGFVSVQVLNEFASVARRKYAVDWPIVRDVIATFRQTLTVVPVTIETHERGLEIAERFSLNIYDAMILAAAELAECGVVYSEDMGCGLAVGRVNVRNPYRGA